MVKHPLALVALTAALVTVAVIANANPVWHPVVDMKVAVLGPQLTRFAFQDTFPDEASCRAALLYDPAFRATVEDLWADMKGLDDTAVPSDLDCVQDADPA